jgi:hypothetical protein
MTDLNYKLGVDDFEVEYEIMPPPSEAEVVDFRKARIAEGLADVEDRLQLNQAILDKLNADIERLTNNADGLDYMVAVASGIITGIVDSVFVGEWNFKEAKAISNKKVNEKVIAFAQKQGYEGDDLAGAIGFLEEKYKLPGDGTYQDKDAYIRKYKDKYKEKYGKITAKTHHLDDFCHHPTLIGLVCCVVVQFTGSTIYYDKDGERHKLPITINEHGNFCGKTTPAKLFSGVVNWFKNIRGHWISDMAGSKDFAGGGMGLPGSFISTLKELAALPCFKNTDFNENLRKAFQNGIGTGKGQIDLKIFNNLFEGAERTSSRFDGRTEMAVKHELKRQALPVMINEALVRGTFFIRRLIGELKGLKENDELRIDWRKVLPLGNRTVERMMLIASGTFMAFDMADAAIRGAIKSGGDPAMFAKGFILRVNFVGVGRFALAVGVDVGMGVKRYKLRDERMVVYGERLLLMNAKVFYKQADAWIAAEATEEAINEAFEMAEKSRLFFIDSVQAIDEDFDKIFENSIEAIEDKNPGLIDDMKDGLKYL